MSNAACWCFTLNNYTDADIDRIKDIGDTVQYCIIGKETGESGTPHLQGFVKFKTRVRLARCKLYVGERAHVEPTRQVPAAIQYCQKDGDFIEFGDLSTTSGRRSDLDSFKESVKAGIYCAKRLREAHSEVFAKYPRFCNDYIADYMPVKVVEDHELRPWQEELTRRLAEPPNDRTIIFVVDYDGNAGKSWFAQRYCQDHVDAQLILPGKVADMSYMLRTDIRVLFCDAPRSKQGEFLQYDFFEHVKNGHVFSPKYESRVKTLNKVHVVIMMNEKPDMQKLSLDRYCLIEMGASIATGMTGNILN